MLNDATKADQIRGYGCPETTTMLAWRERCRLRTWDEAAIAMGVSKRTMAGLASGATRPSRLQLLAMEAIEGRAGQPLKLKSLPP